MNGKFFYDEMLRSDNPIKRLNILIKDKNADNALRHLARLMSMSLNNPEGSQLFPRLVEIFPDACFNKSGTRIKALGDIMKQKFFNPLQPSAVLVPLSELKLAPNTLTRFVKMMRSIIADIERDKNFDRNIDKVKAWLATASRSETPSVEDTASIPLSKILERAATMSRALEKNLEAKNHELEQKTQQLERLNETLAGKEQMIDLLQREQSRKAEIALNVIAEQLRSEYQEFRTALDLPMDVDLGENMRLQLKKLFAILERNGVKFD